MNALISVIIAAYKIEQYLGKCIESIQKQTYKNLEIIVVNDGSPDKCHEIASQYAMNDSRVRVIDKENGGLSDARNAGIAVANGEYIVIVDGDDYVEPEMIELMYKQLQQENADLCICDIDEVNEQGETISTLPASHIKKDVFSCEEMYEKLIQTPNWFYVVAWNKLYKREIFDKVKYRKGRIHEDEIAIHHIIGCCERIATIDKKLYHYVQRQHSITHNGYRVQHLDIVEAYADRAAFFVTQDRNEMAFRMLLRVRTALLDGCVALRGRKEHDVRQRILQLYQMYKDVYQKIDHKSISSDKKKQLAIMNISLTLALYTSGNFWHTIRK